MPNSQIKWLSAPEEHDYPAAASYLSLIFDSADVDVIVRGLMDAAAKGAITSFKAKDIFRASELSLLGISNGHVEKDLRKIYDGKPLSPLLLVRDRALGKVHVADGYHRLCAIYRLSEDETVPTVITDAQRNPP